MATTGSTESEERRRQLLAVLERENVVRLTEAAESLGVSAMTIRRDLADLETEGLLRRVRGGAISVIGPRPFEERRSVRSRATDLIADKALALIHASARSPSTRRPRLGPWQANWAHAPVSS